MWPPASQPSATTASAPQRSMRAANAALATTGTTLQPASFHNGTKLLGLPAPVVITSTCRRASNSAIAEASGFMSITFAPMGLFVISRARSTCASIHSSGAAPQAMMPKPPPAETAPARLPSATQAMPPCITGYFTPKSLFTRVLIILPSFSTVRLRLFRRSTCPTSGAPGQPAASEHAAPTPRLSLQPTTSASRCMQPAHPRYPSLRVRQSPLRNGLRYRK